MATNQKRTQTKQQQKKKSNWLPIAAAVVLVIAVAGIILANNNGGSESGTTSTTGTDQTISESESDTASTTGTDQTISESESGTASTTGTGQTISEGESLVIPVSEVSATAQFYPVIVDGTEMEIIAVKDSGGYIRTAYNTCQICYSSGRGYYVQDGDYLVCQNCGNRFTVDQVEIQSGGCNPWPIFTEDKTVTEEEVSISYDSLKAAIKIFSNWKR